MTALGDSDTSARAERAASFNLLEVFDTVKPIVLVVGSSGQLTHACVRPIMGCDHVHFLCLCLP